MQNVVYCNHALMRSSAGKFTQSRCARHDAAVASELHAVPSYSCDSVRRCVRRGIQALVQNAHI
jgi:hypothetical protein